MNSTNTTHRWRNTFVMTGAMFLCIFVLLTARMVLGEDPVVKPASAAVVTQKQSSPSNSYTWDGSSEGSNSDSSSSSSSSDDSTYSTDDGSSSDYSSGSSNSSPSTSSQNTQSQSSVQSTPTPQPTTSAS
jgi:hypothetical protein